MPARLSPVNSLMRSVTIGQILATHFPVAQDQFVIDKAGFRPAAEIQDDLEQIVSLVGPAQRLLDRRRQHLQQGIQVIGNLMLL